MKASRSQPCADAGSPYPALAPLACALCGEPMQPHEFSQAVRDATDMDICCLCLEEMADASADPARAEVGMVGASR